MRRGRLIWRWVDIVWFSADYRFTTSTGLFPSVFNIAEGADIFVNATCGGGSGIGGGRSASGGGDASEVRNLIQRGNQQNLSEVL